MRTEAGRDTDSMTGALHMAEALCCSTRIPLSPPKSCLVCLESRVPCQPSGHPVSNILSSCSILSAGDEHQASPPPKPQDTLTSQGVPSFVLFFLFQNAPVACPLSVLSPGAKGSPSW